MTSSAYSAPAHVPTELVWDHDLNTFASELDDPFRSVARLYEGPEMIWARSVSRGQAGWLPTRFDVINELFLDAERFSSTENIGVGPLLGVDWRLNPLEIDPPDHRAYRMVLQPWFHPQAVDRLESMIRSVARELIAKFENSGGCEFIEDFASLFPSYIFLELLGLPRAQLPQFLEWEHAFIRSTDMAVRAGGARSIKNYLEEYIEQRRKDPRDDLVTAILTAEIDGKPLNHGEVMGMCMVLYFGGLDTVMSSLGWYFRYLAGDQALQARLRANPADISGTVEDLLRAFGVTPTRRTVKEDLVFRGVSMKKGDVVFLPTFLASRDPSKYENPDQVIPDRNARSITLAAGIHHCLGSHLAKREIKIVLEEFLLRFKDIRIPAGETSSWQTEGVWAVTRLPLMWDQKLQKS